MGRKFYFEQEDKGIIFRTNRCIGDVRIPNYVYDIWMPVIGSDAIGVYGVYCRLEMNGSVKKISQRTLARACRIGTGKLTRINDLLQECGFIDVDKPTGHKRLMHFTTEITVNDPPQAVSSEVIAKHCTDFEPLTPWLTIAETPNSVSGDAKQCFDDTPNGAANIEALGLHPLEFEFTPSSGEKKPQKEPESFDDLFPTPEPTPRRTAEQAIEELQAVAGSDPLSGALKAKETSSEKSWTVPEVAGGADPWERPTDAFCCLHGLHLEDMPPKKQSQWVRRIQEIGEEARATPEQVIDAIRTLPDTELAFKVQGYTTPFKTSFKDDLIMVIAKIATGQIVPREKASAGPSPLAKAGFDVQAINEAARRMAVADD